MLRKIIQCTSIYLKTRCNKLIQIWEIFISSSLFKLHAFEQYIIIMTIYSTRQGSLQEKSNKQLLTKANHSKNIIGSHLEIMLLSQSG